MTIPQCRWTSECRVRIVELDEQHQEIFQLLSGVAEAVEAKDVPRTTKRLEAFITAYRRHITTEETLLSTNGYIGLEKQKKDHAGYIKELEGLLQNSLKGRELSEAQITRVVSWLLAHTKGVDTAYAEFLTGQGVR